MARMSLEDRRQQLVAAAITVMTRDGVRAATTRAVVAEAETSLSVFHYCFDSKHQLLVAVVGELIDRSTRLDGAEQSTVPAGITANEAVRASLDAYWNHVVAHPEVHQLTYEVTQFCLRDEQLAEVAVTQYEMYGTRVANMLREVGVGASLPLDVLARQIAVTVDGLTLDWLVRRDDASSRAALDALALFVDSVLEPAAD